MSETRGELNGYEITSISPGWIKRKVPQEYADDGLKRIVLFFVINTPCEDLSSSSIALSQYGWEKNVWKKVELKKKLLEIAGLERGVTFLPVKKINNMKEACKIIDMGKGFHKKRNKEKIVFYKPNRYSEFLAVFYHIRNSLAHGRLTMYPIKNTKDSNIMFVLEDGVKKNGEFQVRSRMILKKTTLLSWIDVLERKETLENATQTAQTETKVDGGKNK